MYNHTLLGANWDLAKHTMLLNSRGDENSYASLGLRVQVRDEATEAEARASRLQRAGQWVGDLPALCLLAR